jgi:hypothetical protein
MAFTSIAREVVGTTLVSAIVTSAVAVGAPVRFATALKIALPDAWTVALAVRDPQGFVPRTGPPTTVPSALVIVSSVARRAVVVRVTLVDVHTWTMFGVADGALTLGFPSEHVT